MRSIIKWFNTYKYHILFAFIILLMALNIVMKDYYYFTPKNTRYTMGYYWRKIHVVNRSSRMRYAYKYYVNNEEHITSTSTDLSYYNADNMRVLIRYSAVRPGISHVLEDYVPSWVLSPPKEGWKDYPPSIHWKGAELDTLYLKQQD